MILFEHGPDGRPAIFQNPQSVIVARNPDEVLSALGRIEAARRRGLWVAGWMAYEAGLAMEPRLKPLVRPTDDPLLVFGVFDGPAKPEPYDVEDVRLAPLVPRISEADYRAAFDRAQDYIAAGDCYQINLTFPVDTTILTGTPRDLWAALTKLQPVEYGAFADMGVGPVIVSRSPELFFSLSADGRIEARPMKGTAPRHADPVQDVAAAAELAGSEKNRAENLMIVDLLRNDIARHARVGSVRVPELFTVESYATVHQMTSRITAELADPADLAKLMQALFPCGSITGAPKIRAMQIIHELEPFARGIYCGTLGWMAPDATAAFSVAIRTLAIHGNNVTLNVGGGIVSDSTAENEWEEALWKARYVTPLTVPTLP
ncbi:aminodeoxychorismate synthase component I [Paracoccus aestuariivivens]|uniref:Aminodeoxychorismate synthase component I n=1 Tax=Paracoccus aestuariivivens TaxID=1820333 RepID=A0A6L6JER1_9RHOB|nr:aminodeoxychorismate synthase component I [Paracoccus aestuariivivens]MTH79067.1 aminodeoxychorismate synthase component I [Paracoccus aestuariivivens]